MTIVLVAATLIVLLLGGVVLYAMRTFRDAHEEEEGVRR